MVRISCTVGKNVAMNDWVKQSFYVIVVLTFGVHFSMELKIKKDCLNISK